MTYYDLDYFFAILFLHVSVPFAFSCCLVCQLILPQTARYRCICDNKTCMYIHRSGCRLQAFFENNISIASRIAAQLHEITNTGQIVIGTAIRTVSLLNGCHRCDARQYGQRLEAGSVAKANVLLHSMDIIG